MTQAEQKFAKYEGLGNDFILIDGEFDPGRASLLCDRHRGVGADGVIVITKEQTHHRMVVWNADGTRPEMCGNGLRCVARYLVHTGRAQPKIPFEVLTDAGPHKCEVRGDQVSVQMAVPTLVPMDVPVKADAELVDSPIEVNGVSLRITAISMGNPHAVTFDDVNPDELGSALEQHDSFPEGVNAGFAKEVPGGMELRVFERGVGWTQACGTGACAAAVAAVHTGRAERNVLQRVRLPGGELSITVGDVGERITMVGPANRVYEGLI